MIVGTLCFCIKGGIFHTSTLHLSHNGLFWPYQLSVSSPTSEWKCNVTEVMCASSRLITHTHAHEISAEAETTETMMKRGIRLPVNINQSSILQSVSNGIPAESTVNLSLKSETNQEKEWPLQNNKSYLLLTTNEFPWLSQVFMITKHNLHRETHSQLNNLELCI